MAFKPQLPQRTGGGGDFEDTSKYPTPKAGSRKARVSLIVDLGIQEREPFEEDDGTLKEQKPCQQVAAFADLVADVVDYGGDIGKQQYRLLLNKSFQGKVQGINFQGVPQKDAKGNILKDADGKWLPYVLHPANVFTKIAKATEREDIIESMDIEQLLDLPFMAQVEVKQTESKDKKDAEGNPIVYKNVNYKGAAQVPKDDDDVPLPVAALTAKPLCITFDNAKKADIKFIRANLIKQIKQALNYAGSNMQKAVEAFEAEKGGDEAEDAPAPSKPKTTPPAAKKAAKPAPVVTEDDDDSIPF